MGRERAADLTSGTIAIDTSALVAVFIGEDDAPRIAEAIADAVIVLSSAPYVEAGIVLGSTRMTTGGREWLEGFIAREAVSVQPVSVQQAKIASLAFQTFGKGTGHGAGLNFGDCFSYALAKALDVPLLYKGNDFAKTDIVSALS